jgi:hypothetical protein
MSGLSASELADLVGVTAAEVDLDALTAELLVVVDQTIQPTRASLWFRPPVERSPRTGTRHGAVQPSLDRVEEPHARAKRPRRTTTTRLASV